MELKKKPSPWQQVVGSKPIVLGLLFLVMAVLGLPLLWYSPVFSRTEKWFYSIVVTIYTIVLIAITVAICIWAWNKIVGAM